MRNLLYSFTALCVALMATSCLYGKGSDDMNFEDTSGFKVEVSSSVISANGEDTAIFRALLNGEDISSECTLFNTNTNEAMESMNFSTYIAGVYTFYITYGEYKSEDIIVKAVTNIDLSDKNETGLSVTLSTNLVQVSAGSAMFIVRYNGKVILPSEAEKVKIYDAETDTQITVDYNIVETENGTQYVLPAYVATAPGSKSFWIGYKTSNTRETPLTITAVSSKIPTRPADAEPENTNFVHRILFTQFTGTWCGNCPYMIEAFHYMFGDETYKDKFIHTAVHNSDPFAVQLEDGRDLSNVLNTTRDYPYVLANLSTGIANSYAEANISRIMGAIENLLKAEPRAGIAARTELKDNMLLVRASVKASHAGEYFIGAWLVESNLPAKQSNYTSYTEDYIDIHENVVRIADSNLTNFKGHSLGTIGKGERADHLFVMELDPSWKVENCHLVLFASTIQYNSLSITNTVKTTSLTSGVDFEYRK